MFEELCNLFSSKPTYFNRKYEVNICSCFAKTRRFLIAYQAFYPLVCKQNARVFLLFKRWFSVLGAVSSDIGFNLAALFKPWKQAKLYSAHESRLKWWVLCLFESRCALKLTSAPWCIIACTQEECLSHSGQCKRRAVTNTPHQLRFNSPPTLWVTLLLPPVVRAFPARRRRRLYTWVTSIWHDMLEAKS